MMMLMTMTDDEEDDVQITKDCIPQCPKHATVALCLLNTTTPLVVMSDNGDLFGSSGSDGDDMDDLIAMATSKKLITKPKAKPK
jgi:hypothetical protein